jgi:hypothetical protein
MVWFIKKLRCSIGWHKWDILDVQSKAYIECEEIRLYYHTPYEPLAPRVATGESARSNISHKKCEWRKFEVDNIEPYRLKAKVKILQPEVASSCRDIRFFDKPYYDKMVDMLVARDRNMAILNSRSDNLFICTACEHILNGSEYTRILLDFEPINHYIP